MTNLKCLWCGHNLDIVMDSCGTGYTWSLFKCQSCEQLTACGSYIPDAARNDPSIKIRPYSLGRQMYKGGVAQ